MKPFRLFVPLLAALAMVGSTPVNGQNSLVWSEPFTKATLQTSTRANPPTRAQRQACLKVGKLDIFKVDLEKDRSPPYEFILLVSPKPRVFPRLVEFTRGGCDSSNFSS